MYVVENISYLSISSLADLAIFKTQLCCFYDCNKTHFLNIEKAKAENEDSLKIPYFGAYPNFM